MVDVTAKSIHRPSLQRPILFLPISMSRSNVKRQREMRHNLNLRLARLSIMGILATVALFSVAGKHHGAESDCRRSVLWKGRARRQCGNVIPNAGVSVPGPATNLWRRSLERRFGADYAAADQLGRRPRHLFF